MAWLMASRFEHKKFVEAHEGVLLFIPRRETQIFLSNRQARPCDMWVGLTCIRFLRDGFTAQRIFERNTYNDLSTIKDREKLFVFALGM